MSSRAIGSFLGLGTHVWLVVTEEDGSKTTFSGAKVGDLLGVIKDYKRDFDKLPNRGQVVVPPPSETSQHAWDQAVIAAGDVVVASLHKKMRFSGAFPDHQQRGNCCTIANAIIEHAGGCIPKTSFRGFAPGISQLRCR